MTDRQPNLLKENMPGPPIAVLAEALFLANLMLIPVLGFVLMVGLWWKFRHSDSAVVRNHLQQTVVTSISGGAILVGVSITIFLLGGLDNPASWVIGVLYFLCVHAVLILLGMIGLNRAILARQWRYPLLGPRIEE
ncbi:MAG: hypothetical protein Q8L93_12440 [Rhodocyclaceae bacterium]|nr:hypothetical protein [Rhodocyclaceae bacterium]MDP1957698.1 hypothetical protein [Rhodocyclaceae bacterium]